MTTRRIARIRDGRHLETVDALATEEPMEVRLDDQVVAVTMRTPGDDFELAFGYCLSEGVVTSPDEVAAIRYCAGRDEQGRQTYNVVELRRRQVGIVDPALRRRVHTTSACGLCGSASIDAVRREVPSVADDPVVVGVDTLLGLPDALRRAQAVFARTGGLHAAGLFTVDGEAVVVREDVGRHNAVDKVVGWAAQHDALPLRGHVLVVSGRIAFEIVQKALVAGVPVVAAVSAPTNIAVELAAASGMTLVGFVRNGSMNVYAGEGRVVAQAVARRMD